MSSDWHALVEGCFGIEDLYFGSHPLDEARAIDCLKEALGCGATRDDIESKARAFLISRGARAEHVTEQLQVVGDALTALGA